MSDRVVSVAVMVRQVSALAGTRDVNAWENGFIENITRQTQAGRDTTSLTTPQLEILERIWRRHFA